MFDFGFDIGSAIGGIAGAVGGYFAQESANDANADIAFRNNIMAIEMANTAHQREVKDLIAAGINPVLTADGGGSPMPHLATPEMQPTLKSGDIQNAVNSAFTANMQRAQVENLKAQNENIKAQNNKIAAETDAIQRNVDIAYKDLALKTLATRYPGKVGGLFRSIINGLLDFKQTIGKMEDERELEFLNDVETVSAGDDNRMPTDFVNSAKSSNGAVKDFDAAIRKVRERRRLKKLEDRKVRWSRLPPLMKKDKKDFYYIAPTF